MLAIPKWNREELAKFSLSASERAQYERLKRAARDSEGERKNKRLHAKILDIIEQHTEDLRLMPVRVYTSQRKQWKDLLGKKFEHRMKKFADEARHTIYHEYAIARQKLKKEGKGARKSKTSVKGKRRSGKGKRKKRNNAEILAAALGNVSKMATPKKPPPPAKISRGKIGEMKPETINRLKIPKHFTPKYVDDSMHAWRNAHFVSLHALTYTPTPRIYELAVHKYSVVEPPLQVGAVDPEALTAKASPRIIELAIPKARSAVQEADYNEDAFKVSPNALHYKATERIIELAKPLERD